MTEEQATKLARNIIQAVRETISLGVEGPYFSKLVSKLKNMSAATFEE